MNFRNNNAIMYNLRVQKKRTYSAILLHFGLMFHKNKHRHHYRYFKHLKFEIKIIEN